MPSKCCVPGCHSNYVVGGSRVINVRVFQFPEKEKSKDTYLKWLDAVNRPGWQPTARTAVCIKHFQDEDVIKEDFITKPDGTVARYQRSRFKLRPDAVPSIFPKSIKCCKQSGRRKIQCKQNRKAKGNKTKRKKKIMSPDKIKEEKMEYTSGNDNMKQQQEEAGTSSSMLIPTEELSFPSSTPVDKYCPGPSNIQPPYQMKEARKFVNVAFFVKSLQDLNNHGGDGCSFSDMNISGEAKCGWNSGIQLSCNICLATVIVWMDDFGDQLVAAPTKMPPTLANTVPVEAPIISQKAPAKKPNTRSRKTTTDSSVQQHFLVSSKSNMFHQDMVYNPSKQVIQPIQVIKQEIIPTEDIRSSGKNRVISSATQPGTVQLLLCVKPLRSVPTLETSLNEMIVPVTPSDVLPIDSNLPPGSVPNLNPSVNEMIVPVTPSDILPIDSNLSPRRVPNLDTSVNEMIVPDVTPPEVLPVDLNLVKKEIEDDYESRSMEVVADCFPHLVPKSETSLVHSKTSFDSELLTGTGHSKVFSPIKMKPMSSTKTNSKSNRKKYVASSNDTPGTNNCTLSLCSTSIIPQRSFQILNSSSKTDAEKQTSNGEPDKIGLLALENKLNTNS